MSETPERSDDGLEIFDGPPAVPDTAAPAPVVATAPRPAPPALRALAWLLDGLGTVLVTIVVVMAGLSGGGMQGLTAIYGIPIVATVFLTVLTAVAGVTPGKAVLGLRVVRVGTDRPPRLWAVPRSLVLVAPLLVTVAVLPFVASGDAFLPISLLLPNALWLGMFAVIVFRPRYRGLQDLAGRSEVVRVR